MKKRSVVIGWLCSYMIVLLIPFVTIFSNYAWNKKVIKNEILEANQLVLENLGNEIDRYLNREFLFRSFLLQERTFQKVISSRKKDPQFYYDVAELVNVMSSYSSDMSCVIYLKEQDYVISSRGANDSAPLYNGKKVAFPDIMTYDAWMEVLSGEYQNDFFLGEGLYYGNTKSCLVYADSVNDYLQYEPFNLFVCIPVSSLEELTRLLPEGSVLLVGVEGKTVLSLSNQGMEEARMEPERGWDGGAAAETDLYMEICKSSKIGKTQYCLMIPKNKFWEKLRQVRNMFGISIAVTLLVGAVCVSVLLNRNFQPLARLVRAMTGGSGKRQNEFKLIEDAYSRLMGETNVLHRHIAIQAEQMRNNDLLAVMKGRRVETVENIRQIDGKDMILAGFRVPMMDEKQILQDEVMLYVADNIFSELMSEYEFYRIEDGQLLFYLFLCDEKEREQRENIYKFARHLCDFLKEREVSLCGVLSSTVNGTEHLRFAYQEVLEGLESVKMFRKCGIVDMEEQQISGGKGIVRSVSQYVEEHIADSELNINTVAEGIGRNPKYISRIFKEETGEGILDYVNRQRIRKAQVLMRSENMTLEQIGGMVGYASSKTFRRAFQKETGMMPGDYLKDNKKEEGLSK